MAVKALVVRAKDLMQTDVVTLSVDDSIVRALEVFAEYKIGGAPVTGPSGDLVGVVSASDIVRSEEFMEDGQRWAPSFFSSVEEEEELWEEGVFGREDYSPEVLGRTVGDLMSHNAVTVAPDDTLARICQLLAKENIHRVLVVARGSVRGIVSTMDIVRYLAQHSE